MLNPKLFRKRKTKAPCPGCYMHSKFCLCDQIPKLKLKTKVSLIIHAKELKRTTNTGRLAHQALVNSEMNVRGADRAGLDLSGLITEEYESLILFPSADAVELTSELVGSFARPIHLIVPDGNWRQASKVHTRHKELQKLPRVMLGPQKPSVHHLRSEATPNGMATLQAVAYALRVLEGEAVFSQLMSLYQLKLERTLIGRGLLKGSDILPTEF